MALGSLAFNPSVAVAGPRMVRQSVSNQAKLGQQKRAEEILELPVERQQGQSRHVKT